jgi:hypothetical protein
VINLKVDIKDLLKTVQNLEEEAPAQIGKRVANALNQVGEGVVRNISLDVADRTGVPFDVVNAMIIVTKARPHKLVWEADVAMIMKPEFLAGRKIPSKLWEGKRGAETFQEGSLVKIITAGDEKVCLICEELSKGGPYTVAEADEHLNHGKGVHPNCRCAMLPFVPTTKFTMKRDAMPASPFGKAEPGSTKKFTLKDLAKIMEKEGALAIQAIK